MNIRNHILFVILICTGCNNSNYSPVGYWKGSSGDLMITENNNYLVLKRQNNELEYLSKSSNKIDIDETRLLITFNDNNQQEFFKSKEPLELQPWAITEGLSKQLIEKNFKSPDTIIISQAGAEKWFYRSGYVLIFDDTSLISIKRDQKIERKFDKINIGITKEEVIKLIGNPDRKNYRETKWYYGTAKQLLFRDNKLKEINQIADNSGFLTWREEALKSFNDNHLIKRDIEKFLIKIEEFKNQYLLNFPIDRITKLYGIKEKKDEDIPLILFAEVDQTAFPPSMYRLNKELKNFGPSLEKRIKQEFSVLVKDANVSEPKLDRQRQLIEIESNISLINGVSITNKQTIFFRYDQMLLIQMSVTNEDLKYLSYYDDILNDFDI